MKTTPPNSLVTISAGDPAGMRQMTFAETRQLLYAHLSAGRYAPAASIAMQLVDQLPEDPWPPLVAAESLLLRQLIEPATHLIDRALDIDPGNVGALIVKSRICLSGGRHDEARRLVEAAIRLAPNHAQVHFEKGELLSELGDLDGAREALLRAIAIDPRNVSSLFRLSRLPGSHFSEELVKQCEFLIGSGQLPANDLIKLHFTLANVYEKQNEIDRQFHHLLAGNDLKDRQIGFDPEPFAKEANANSAFFSPEFFARTTGIQGNPAKIIFIIGFPRCGSTLIEQILSSHPDVSAAGETFALRHAIEEFGQSNAPGQNYPAWVAGQSGAALAEIADSYLHKVRQFNVSACMTDKLLDNYRFVGMIHLLFPQSVIVNVRRNPIDVCYSCYKNMFHLASVPYSYNLENLAAMYRNYSRYIRHWNETLPGRIHTVDYERLVASQEEVTRELLDGCALPWNDACLDFHRNERSVATNSSIQVRQPLYGGSVARWKRAEKYLGPLLELTNE